MDEIENEWLPQSKYIEKEKYFKVFNNYSQVPQVQLTNIYDPPLTMKEIKKLRRDKRRQMRAKNAKKKYAGKFIKDKYKLTKKSKSTRPSVNHSLAGIKKQNSADDGSAPESQDKEQSENSHEEEEDEEEEESESEEDTESEDEEILNKLRFRRKVKTIDVNFKYVSEMTKLQPEVSKKERPKENIRKRTIVRR